MQSLWFIVPAHGRVDLARICLTQLRRTCDELERNGVRATAVVVADDENLDTARDLGFGWAKRNNRFLGRKFNDGIQLAVDPSYNKHPANYVVPIGSDDWVDWRLFVELPPNRTMYGFQSLSFVEETGKTLTTHKVGYTGGCGIRIYPRVVMQWVGGRPCDEDRRRACDTSILVNLTRAGALKKVEHRDIDPLQIVDWKSPDEQVTSYKSIVGRHRPIKKGDPFKLLAGRFPAEALEDMRALYEARVPVAA